MPFLEFLGNTILILIFLGLVGACLYYGAIAVGIFLGATLLIGWVPIGMCLSDPDWKISFDGEEIVEVWAAIAAAEYTVLTVVLIVFWISKPAPCGLPRGLKFLALFYPHPARRVIGNPQQSNRHHFNGEALAASLRDRPKDAPPPFVSKLYTREAKALTEQLRADTKLINAAIEREHAQTELDILRDQ